MSQRDLPPILKSLDIIKDNIADVKVLDKTPYCTTFAMGSDEPLFLLLKPLEGDIKCRLYFIATGITVTLNQIPANYHTMLLELFQKC